MSQFLLQKGSLYVCLKEDITFRQPFPRFLEIADSILNKFESNCFGMSVREMALGAKKITINPNEVVMLVEYQKLAQPYWARDNWWGVSFIVNGAVCSFFARPNRMKDFYKPL